MDTAQRYKRAVNAAKKVLKDLSEGNGDWQAAVRKLDLLDSAIDWHDFEQSEAAKELRQLLRTSEEAGRLVRAATREVELKRLDGVIRDQKVVSWRGVY